MKAIKIFFLSLLLTILVGTKQMDCLEQVLQQSSSIPIYSIGFNTGWIVSYLKTK
jgi:hypothetical protein